MTLGTLLLPLATTAPDPSTVKPGVLAFVIFLAMFAATILLWLSMRRQLRKVTFEEAPDPEPRTPGPGRTRES